MGPFEVPSLPAPSGAGILTRQQRRAQARKDKKRLASVTNHRKKLQQFEKTRSINAAKLRALVQLERELTQKVGAQT